MRRDETRRLRTEQARAVVASGMTLAGWCRLNGVPAPTLRPWLVRLSEEGAVDGPVWEPLSRHAAGAGPGWLRLPDGTVVAEAPMDMRAGAGRLAAEVAAGLGLDPSDGSTYAFVSRDCRQARSVALREGGWEMRRVGLGAGWLRRGRGRAALQVRRGCLSLVLGALGAVPHGAPATPRKGRAI